MEALLKAKPLVRMRKIDVVDWDSPVAAQFDISRLPTLHLYAGRERLSTSTPAILARLNDL